MFDLLIKGGQIVDGTGGNSYVADLGVKDGKISAIGNLSAMKAEKTINAEGLVVAPGFIDIHTHSDGSLLMDPRAESQIRQGVTTEVIGQCGVSLAPCTEEIRTATFAKMGAPDFGDWQSYGELLAFMDKVGIATNVVGMVGHGALRETVMGENAPRAATEGEIAEMTDLMEKSMEEGAFGLTTGLEYHPGKEATYDELASLCRIVAKADGLYATHTRNRDSRYFVGFGEALDVARESGVRLQISHINPKYGRPEHTMRNTIQMIEWAREEGVDVAMDVMPTNWNHTSLTAILPSWSFELSKDDLFELFSSKEGREKLKVNPLPVWQLVVEEKWDQIRLLSCRASRKYLGWTFEEIGKDKNISGWDVVFDLFLNEGDAYKGVMATGHAFSEDDNKQVLAHALCSVISDTMALSNDGPMKDFQLGLIGYNWTSRFITHYIRDEKVLSLEEGIRRITSLPASRLGLKERGQLTAGAAADITIFNLSEVKDNSSFDNPTIYADGFEHVIVNGVLAFSEGRRTPDHAGIVLRRK